MLSKISIAVGDNHKPAIRVQEVIGDDVRDNLVRNMRGLLNSSSATFKIDFQSSDVPHCTNYLISPVENELEYFYERIQTILNCVPTSDKENAGIEKIYKLIGGNK